MSNYRVIERKYPMARTRYIIQKFISRGAGLEPYWAGLSPYSSALYSLDQAKDEITTFRQNNESPIETVVYEED